MKKIMRTAAVAASFLAMATAANATVYNVNMYGSSSQFRFWNDVAVNFLSNYYGCADVRQDFTTAKDSITMGTNCWGGSSDVIYIRYSARTSAEGPRAALGIDPDYSDPCYNSGSRWDDVSRMMADETSVDWNPYTVVGTNKCVDVNVGVSDVASYSFVQKTTGKDIGYTMTGWVKTYDMLDSYHPDDSYILVAHRPVIVPFAFFLNGQANNSSVDALGNRVVGTGDIKNLSRVQIVNLMAGKVYNWSQFGAGFPAKKAVICARHAGSGAHATLDMAVMRGDMTLAMVEGWPTLFSPLKPYYFFHTVSSDLMQCVNRNGVPPTTIAGYTPPSMTNALAVGYAEADATALNPITGINTYPNTVVVSYEGVEPTKVGITNGTYSFWSQQWIYENPYDPTYDNSPITQMLSFVSDPANMPVGKAAVWATASELKVTKPADTALPIMN